MKITSLPKTFYIHSSQSLNKVTYTTLKRINTKSHHQQIIINIRCKKKYLPTLILLILKIEEHFPATKQIKNEASNINPTETAASLSITTKKCQNQYLINIKHISESISHEHQASKFLLKYEYGLNVLGCLYSSP